MINDLYIIIKYNQAADAYSIVQVNTQPDGNGYGAVQLTGAEHNQIRAIVRRILRILGGKK